ncbi:arylsulfatase [Oleiharenicola lentus]|uniref:Arylsulfatase n=1 Tax=Oleiharenicola lentus TaxID=2508720 RepID=A0A4Q1CAP0_9BACT|nr:arylsulfatase [Oleiharenicola lentus]RXK55941.1 arylsulfatase [Oleiharenicola lentus]
MKFLVWLCPLVLACALPAAPVRPPNIVFILTDDQGYGDIAAHGHPILQTPNLDRLHAASVRFTDFQVSPTCAPTRSALLTGRHEFKNGVTHTILERERLTLDATTLAEVLRTAGYATGIFGKWHLGDEAAYRPERRGFDEVFIHGAGGIGQTYPGSCGDAPGNTYFDPTIYHNGKFERTVGYCTDVFFNQAMRWIDVAAATGKPFYAHLATNAPHIPLQVRPADEARYAGIAPDAETAKYLGMVANIDDNVGRLLDHLRVRGLERDTLVIFMTDNGGLSGVRIWNHGMRGQKVTPWRGGVRAVSFWSWPGRITPGEVAVPAAHIDFFPTLAELAGVPLAAETRAQIEGRSLVPLLENPVAPWADRTLVTHVGRWPRGTPPEAWKYRNVAIRDSRWRLVSIKGATEPAWQLYDYVNDPGEQHDVAATHPGVVQKLAANYDQWWDEMRPQLVNEDAPLPKLNPFKELYWQQFGGGPNATELEAMDPDTFFSKQHLPAKTKG